MKTAIGSLLLLLLVAAPVFACNPGHEDVLRKHEGSVAYEIHVTAPEGFKWVKLWDLKLPGRVAAWYPNGLLRAVLKEGSEPDWADVKKQLADMGCTLESVKIKKKAGEAWQEFELPADE